MAAHKSDDAPMLVGEAIIPSGPEAPQAGRAAMSRWLDGHTAAAVRADACLLVSELITNSVGHARVPAGTPLHVKATTLNGTIRVEVTDRGHATAMRTREPDASGGFGLHLLDALAARWGFDREQGTLVWFELAA